MKVAFIFSFSISLHDWYNSGLLLREKLIHEKLINQGSTSSAIWFTYGSNDSPLANYLHVNNLLSTKISVCGKPRIFPDNFLGNLLYSFLIPFIYFKKFSCISLIHSNQFFGAHVAALASFLFRKCFVLRCGYVPSLYYEKSATYSRINLFFHVVNEVLCSLFSNYIVLPTSNIPWHLKMQFFQKKIKIIPNYIDSSLFRSTIRPLERHSTRLLFVGRLVHEKNLFNLLYSLRELNIGLDLVGSGPLKSDLLILSKQLDLDVNFLGSFDNKTLSSIYNKYKFFVLPSYTEGLPKVLLEAMSCGCIPLITPNTGNLSVVCSNSLGFVSSGFSASDLKVLIEHALNYKDFDSLSATISEFIHNNYSVDSIVRLYADVYLTCANDS